MSQDYGGLKRLKIIKHDLSYKYWTSVKNRNYNLASDICGENYNLDSQGLSYICSTTCERCRYVIMYYLLHSKTCKNTIWCLDSDYVGYHSYYGSRWTKIVKKINSLMYLFGYQYDIKDNFYFILR